MRHSLAQLLAASSSGRGGAREASAACSLPPEGAPGRGGRSSPGEAADPDEAEPRREAAVLNDPDGGEDELLFPAGLELYDWLEAAVAEARPGWETGSGAGSSSPSEAEPPSGPGPARPGSSRLKAAAAARLNRQKKKQYVLGLESRLQGLAAENRQLRDRNRGLCRRLRHLERETSYLRAVLANQSALGRLLSHLAGDGAGRVGLRISTSLFEDHAAVTPLETWLPCESNGGGGSDHDYALPVPKEEEEEEGDGDDKRAISSSPGGICLHVDRDQVSVEFCSVCARRAASSAFAAASISPSSFASKMCLPCQAPLCRG